MAQLFISYSTRNADFARYLRSLLQDAGFDVWMDETKLSAGQSWTDTLEANITNCAAFVIIMSPESKASDWVRRERLLAERLRKPMFPILFSGEAWWDLANIQYEDMRAGVKASLSPRMIEALRRAISGEATVAESESTGTHIPVAAPPVAQNDARKLEAAMPAETKAGSDTEVWAKISLPSSEGLRGELPVVVPSGDVIQKGDARASSFPVRFPVDAHTGQRLPIQAELRLSAGDFLIAAPGERIEVEIPPDSDSRTVIFMLEANPQGKKSGRSRIVIDLIYEAKIIAQISVSTVLVEQVTAAVPSWTLAAAVYAAPPTGAISPVLGEIAPGSAAASEVALRDVPSAQPSVNNSPVAPAQLSDERERRERREQREQQDRGAFGAAVPPADDVDGDDVLPTYDEKAKKSEAADSYVPQPATTPQYSGSATRSPMGEPQGMPSGSQAAFEPMPRRAPRRASNTPLRLASVFAGLGLVFVVVLAITRQAAIPLNVNGSATATLATQFALLITETPLHVSTVVATVLSTASCGDDRCSVGETSNTCPKDCAVLNPFITETPTSQPTATSSEASDGFTATPQIPAITHSPTELPNSGGGPGDIEVAPMVDCSGVPGSDLVRLLIRNGLAAVLLDEGITTQYEARQFSESNVVAWGVCKRDNLTLNLELMQTPNVRGITNLESITLQTQPDMLAQRDSHAARVVGAVTEYAAGSSDYTALAQTFEDLAASATSADERAALRTLQSNSSYLANHPDMLTQVALTQASR